MDPLYFLKFACFHIHAHQCPYIIYNRTVGFALYPFLQPEFRGIGLQLRSYRGTLGQGGRRKRSLHR